MSKKRYNINGTVSNVRTGKTKEKETLFVNYTLVSEKPGKNGEPKKYLVDAYGKAAEQMIAGGFAVEGAKVRVWGEFRNEKRTNKETGKDFRLSVLNQISCETPKTPEEIEALRAAKAARKAAEAEATA